MKKSLRYVGYAFGIIALIPVTILVVAFVNGFIRGATGHNTIYSAKNGVVGTGTQISENIAKMCLSKSQDLQYSYTAARREAETPRYANEVIRIEEELKMGNIDQQMHDLLIAKNEDNKQYNASNLVERDAKNAVSRAIYDKNCVSVSVPLEVVQELCFEEPENEMQKTNHESQFCRALRK